MLPTTRTPVKQAANEAPPPRRWRRWIGALLLMLLIGGLVWAVRPAPRFSRVQELQKELAESKDLSPDERKAKFAQLRDEMKHLTDDQKWQLSAPMREKQKAEMDRYFALAPKEKIKYLDERIDKSEKMRKEWEKKGAMGKAGGPLASGFVGGPGGGGAGGTHPKQRSSEEMEKRRKEMLDRSSPKDRAQMDRFRKEMNDRRKQRGLPVK